MAEPSRTPSLPNTADEVAYAPVSWLAVGSVAVAGLFVFLLVFFGYDAFRGKKSLIMPELMLLAGIAVVLSFAARRVIRTSEGTRTGENLTNVAWWMAVVAGVVYGAYWLAIEYSIRQNAQEEVKKWVDTVLKGEVAPAFHRTLEPGRRVKINAADEGKMTAEFRDQVIAFRQTDFVRLATRNQGEACEFKPGGLRDWVTKPKLIECVFTGTFKCPEGAFPIHVPLKGGEGGPDGGVRQWQIVPAQNGYIQGERVALTRYGWLLGLLEKQGGDYGKQFVGLASGGGQPYAYHLFAKPGDGQPAWAATVNTTLPRVALGGGPAVAVPLTADYSAYVAGGLFALPGGGEPSAAQKAQFQAIWNASGVVMSGQRLRSSPDTADTLSLVRDEQKKVIRVEVRVPVELPLPGVESDMAAARGRVVVECVDPAALDLVNQVRASGANPDQPLLVPPDEYRRTVYRWRVVRIESDLYRVTVQQRMEGAGGPPPGGGH